MSYPATTSQTIGRHHRNSGRLAIGMPVGIRSERRSPSRWNRGRHGSEFPIGALFDTKTKELERTTEPRKLLGLRIGVVGGCVAVGSWVVAVYASQPVGFMLTATGVGTGFLGMGIHYVNMFKK